MRLRTDRRHETQAAELKNIGLTVQEVLNSIHRYSVSELDTLPPELSNIIDSSRDSSVTFRFALSIGLSRVVITSGLRTSSKPAVSGKCPDNTMAMESMVYRISICSFAKC